MLMSHSDLHSEWTALDVYHWIMPPVALGQYVLFKEAGRPVAMATWAFVDDEVHRVLRSNERPLHPAEWQGGKNIWVMDLIAPFGHARRIVRELRNVAVRDGLENMTVHWKRRYMKARTEA